MRHAFMAFGAASFMALAGFNKSASAGLSIVSDQVGVDQADQEVFFNIDFNHVPNFTTRDTFGRPEDSFQYEIVPNTLASIDTFPFSAISAVIRGDEIGSGHVIPIRNGISGGIDPNPAAGGWGSTRGTVPFTLSGDELSFATSFKLLGTTNGNFSYRLFTTNYGSTVSLVNGTSSSVPLPAALPASLVTIGAFAGVGLLRRRFAEG